MEKVVLQWGYVHIVPLIGHGHPAEAVIRPPIANPNISLRRSPLEVACFLCGWLIAGQSAE